MRHALLAIAVVLGLGAGGAGGAGCGKTRDEPVTSPAPPKSLRIGVTLHPYYSWTANVIANVPSAEVVPVLPGEVDAESYRPTRGDIARLASLDAIVVNGIGHDDFIKDMVAASGSAALGVIEANAGTPLLPVAHGEGRNAHTFISYTNAIRQTQRIATRLAELRPESATRFRDNAAAYADRLRDIRNAAAARLDAAKDKRVVTVHDGYAYLLQELGIELAGVVQPAHGFVPSAQELADLIALMKRERVAVVLSEENFADDVLAKLRTEAGARVYVISHLAVGTYSATEFETVMAKNTATLVQALVTDAR
jgi:zinc transport system substrate-binding protein